MWLTILALFACPAAPAAAPPEPTPVTVIPVMEAPPAPVAPPTGRAVVTTARPVMYSGVAWRDAVQRAAEFARQQAHACYARDPSFEGVLDVNIAVNDQGRVTDVRSEPTSPPVMACIKGAIMAVRFPAASGEFPILSVNAQWRFAVVPTIDLEHDCVEDRECGLVTGGCGGPDAVARREADRVDEAHQRRMSVATCDGHLDPPSFARCVEGSCKAVPADLVELRGCASDAGCAVIERWCGWDTVATKRADEGGDRKAELDAIPCDGPRGTPPPARCVYQQCTLDWAGK